MYCVCPQERRELVGAHAALEQLAAGGGGPGGAGSPFATTHRLRHTPVVAPDFQPPYFPPPYPQQAADYADPYAAHLSHYNAGPPPSAYMDRHAAMHDPLAGALVPRPFHPAAAYDSRRIDYLPVGRPDALLNAPRHDLPEAAYLALPGAAITAIEDAQVRWPAHIQARARTHACTITRTHTTTHARTRRHANVVRQIYDLFRLVPPACKFALICFFFSQ